MTLENDGAGDNGGQGRRRIHLREISGDHDSPLNSVGQDLRAARLRRGDEIAAVSRALKIRKDHLEALEEDRLEDLPGRTYALGFVRSYSQYLGLDPALTTERFKQEMSGRAEETVHAPAPIHTDERRLPYGWRFVAVVVVAMLGYGAWYFLSQKGDFSQPVPPAPVLNPPKAAATPAPSPVIVPQQEAVTSPAADASRPGNTSEDDADSALPTPATGPKSPATRLTNPVAAQPQTSQQTAGQQDASGSPAVPSPGQGAVYGQQNPGPRVVLRATGDTRVTVRGADGSLYINRDLKAGDVYKVPNMTGLSLATNNAGRVEVDLDGQRLGRVGQEQQILGRVSLEPQSLSDRFNR